MGLYEIGEFERSLDIYNQLANIHPDSDNVWYNRGLALKSLGRNEEAVLSFDKALAINPIKRKH